MGVEIVAEIGANHNGDMELAAKMITAAAEVGANTVKFQSWSSSDFICTAEYTRNTQYADKHRHFGSLYDMVNEYQLSKEQHQLLFEKCKEAGVEFFSSVFSRSGLDLLLKLGVRRLKVASMDVTYLELLRMVGGAGKPVVMSCGMATLGEIEKAVKTLESAGCQQLTLLHCVAVYPCPDNDVNLRFMETLRTAFGMPVGFSDHTAGFGAAIAAASLGAVMIEKHFTLDKELPGWDHHISATPTELKLIVDGCRSASAALGTNERTIPIAEQVKAAYFRRSWVTTRRLLRGWVITPSDIVAKRPASGIPPDQDIVGRSLCTDLEEDVTINAEDLQ